MGKAEEAFWKQFDALPMPTAEETARLGQIDPVTSVLLEEDSRPALRYLEVQKLYRMLFSVGLLAKSGLDRLDERLCQEGFQPKDWADMDYYQRYDLLGLRYFYVRSYIHVERLSAEEVDVLTACLANRQVDAVLDSALKLVEATYQKILEVSPEHPQQQFALFPDIHGAGTVSGDTIALALCTQAVYDANGMLRDEQAEERRIRVCRHVQRQLEPILEKLLGTPVFVMVEV